MTTLPLCCEDAAAQLDDAGLDLVTFFDATAYNRAIAGHPFLRPLETFGRDHVLALLVGNTRALWPALRRAIQSDPTAPTRDPVDNYVARNINACVENCQISTHVYLSHEEGPRLVSMLHAAEVSGMAQVGPAHLALHPRHGLWFALRAVVVFDWPWEGSITPSVDLCSSCEAPCVDALNTAIAKQGDTPYRPGDGPTWRNWVQIREVCPVGQDGRYSEAQIRYHYTLDPDTLRGP
ncbi:MAG: hypothetical protein QF464_01980 [Myxococcota bacterium]|nr:hypothetical protein [Myxococcota bacterium]